MADDDLVERFRAALMREHAAVERGVAELKEAIEVLETRKRPLPPK